MNCCRTTSSGLVVTSRQSLRSGIHSQLPTWCSASWAAGNGVAGEAVGFLVLAAILGSSSPSGAKRGVCTAVRALRPSTTERCRAPHSPPPIDSNARLTRPRRRSVGPRRRLNWPSSLALAANGPVCSPHCSATGQRARTLLYGMLLGLANSSRGSSEAKRQQQRSEGACDARDE